MAGPYRSSGWIWRRTFIMQCMHAANRIENLNQAIITGLHLLFRWDLLYLRTCTTKIDNFVGLLLAIVQACGWICIVFSVSHERIRHRAT